MSGTCTSGSSLPAENGPDPNLESGTTCGGRSQRATERRIKAAKFPVTKTLDTFDFLALPALNKKLVLELVARRVLEEWRRVAPFTGSQDFVFSIRTNSPINLKNAVGRHVKPACREHGIPVVSWHDLRHTYTTWGRRAGVKAESMRDQLGHSSVKTTLDIYSHLDSEDGVAEAIEAYGTEGKLLPLSVTPAGDGVELTH